jgi:hypothetical protein
LNQKKEYLCEQILPEESVKTFIHGQKREPGGPLKNSVNISLKNRLNFGMNQCFTLPHPFVHACGRV